MSKFELTIYRLILKDIGQEEFERWVYAERKLDELLIPDEYLELISLNYKTPSSLYEAKKILRKYIDLGKCYEWYLKGILQKIVDRSCDAHKHIEQLYELYCDGYYFLDNLGLGYGLAITVPHHKYKAEQWYKLTSQQQSALIDELYPAVANEAIKVILWLESGKIIFTGHSGEYQGIEYEDHRTAKEKNQLV